jgi:predicted kinase
MLILMAGLPGTGKSTLARAIAARTGGAVLDKDPIRAALFSPADIEYTAEQDDFCMELMLETAAWLWRRDASRVVLLDGRTFSRRYQRERAIERAGALRQSWRVIECICSEELARSRLEADLRAGSHPAGNRTPELYAEVARHWEPVAEPKIVIDTGQPVEICLEKALRYIARDTMES